MGRYLVSFEKGEPVRWLGHLDVKRAFERALRRSGLPLAFTAGFNPHPRLAFASALPVGVTAGADVALLELAEDLPGDAVVERLNAALPAGFRVHAARGAPDSGARDALNRYCLAEMEVLCSAPAGLSAADADRAIAGLMARPALPVTRERNGRTRTLDARPLIAEMCLAGLGEEGLTLAMTLVVSQEGALRAEEVVGLLSELLPGVAVRRAHRKRLRAPEE